MSAPWTQDVWRKLERSATRAALAAISPEGQWRAVTRAARAVLQNYSTSFFIVTRFLPAAKRSQVEIIYAAVRYPDEIVDTFPLSEADRLHALDTWMTDYEQSLGCASLEAAIAAGGNCFAAAFAQVVREKRIPTEYYRAFIEAMRLDVEPRRYADLEDLVESYIYGSATVVGYFLAYVYGASGPREFDRALTASRDLGIALQLTNFLRDVREDKRRGRVYLPDDMLRAEGLTDVNPDNARSLDALNRVLRQLSGIAEGHYRQAERNLDAFAPDCRMAIQACIDVYRELNLRIGRSHQGILHRESVPMSDKFRVLPSSKYWRVPLAYLGAI
jgi:phytoene synthase